MEDQAEDEPLILETFGSSFQRAILLAGGLFAVIMPAWELRYAFVSLGWWTIFFGVIVLGAWSVGFSFLAGAVLGDRVRWRFDGGVLTLDRASLVRRREDTFTGADIARTEIRTIEWDSREPSYSVVVHTVNGETLETPERSSLASAEALEADIRRRLGLRS